MLNQGNKLYNVIFFGPPGCGKGTQGNKISQSFGYYRLSTGDLLRSISNSDDEAYSGIRKFLSSGQLVPDHVVNELVRIFYIKNSDIRHILLDGFPRNIDQAIEFSKFLATISSDINLVVKFNVSDESLVKRITGRVNCKNCGATYNTNSSMPKQEGVCDYCGSTELFIREDDKLEVLQARLSSYRKLEKDIINFYQDKVVEIDAEQSPDDVFKEITEIFDKFHLLERSK